MGRGRAALTALVRRRLATSETSAPSPSRIARRSDSVRSLSCTVILVILLSLAVLPANDPPVTVHGIIAEENHRGVGFLRTHIEPIPDMTLPALPARRRTPARSSGQSAK